MSTAKQTRLGLWTIRTLAPLALAAAASAAQASLAISTAPTSNVNCAGSTCRATATDAVLNVTDLKTLLQRGNVNVNSGRANDIAVNAALNWTRTSRLTLSANTGVTVTQPIVVEGRAAVTLTSGDIAFAGHGRLDFWDTRSKLVINGNSYTLVDDVASLVSAIAANTHGYFALAKSYDAQADAAYTASPIYVLYGSLNGLGHAISNLKIQSAETDVGFVAYLVMGSAPTVSNLTLAHIEMNGTADGAYIGGLAGYSQGRISHVRVTGHVSGPNATAVGGIVGWQTSNTQVAQISDSSVNAVVSGGTASVAGGIVGLDLYSGLLRCSAAGKIVGDYVGGLEGDAELDLGNITQSWSSAHAIGPISGGLVGLADGKFTLADNYASGLVSSGGGLIGSDVGITSTAGNTIQTSYAFGHIRGGGVTGNDDGSGVYANVYWDMDTTHITNPAKGVYNIPNYPGVTGLSDAQMKAALPAGFSPSVWGLNPSINNGYPYLLANPPQE